MLAPAREPDENCAARIAYAASLKQGSHIHISGICGSGTAAVLVLLRELGFYVTGSDKAFYPPMGDVVRSLAHKLYEGYRAENLEQRPALVVIGNAQSRGNPEVEHVLEHKLPFASMPEVFAALLIGTRAQCRTSVVISGTHGKTTTSAAVSTVLDAAGRKPGYFIGGVPLSLSGNVRPVSQELKPEQRVVVLEGDEYDSAFFAKYAKFQCYRPDIAVVTSLEFDHGDIYNSIEEIESEFTSFLRRVPQDGLVLVCDQGGRLPETAQKWKQDSSIVAPVVLYGLTPEAQYRLTRRESREVPGQALCGQQMEFLLSGEALDVFTPLTGEHNALNLLAAAAVCSWLGVEPEKISKGIAGFRGVRRRQQVIFNQSEVAVIEDFAHHPTAVRTTLAGIKEAYPGRRLIAVFEPRSNTSRRAFFQDEYPVSFDACDIAVILEVADAGGYQGTARQVGALDVPELTRQIMRRGKTAACFRTVKEIEDFLCREIRSGDLTVLMSNGDFGGLAQTLPRALQRVLRNNTPK